MNNYNKEDHYWYTKKDLQPLIRKLVKEEVERIIEEWKMNNKIKGLKLFMEARVK